jgi:hypothetical protein
MVRGCWVRVAVESVPSVTSGSGLFLEWHFMLYNNCRSSLSEFGIFLAAR